MTRPELLCQKRGCTRQATHAIKICVPHIGVEDETCCTTVVIGVKLCPEHLDADEPENWLTGDCGASIRPAFTLAAAGDGQRPDFDRAYIVGVPLSSPEMGPLAPRVLN